MGTTDGKGFVSRIVVSVTNAWLDPDAKFSLLAARVGIASSVIWMLARTMQPSGLSTLADPGAYRPVGIMSLFGPGLPPFWAIAACWWVALFSTCLWLVGKATRTTAVASALTTLIVTTFVECFGGGYWSHGANFILLAQIAFLPAAFGARTRYPVYLAQFALGAAFLSASSWKLFYSGLPWVFSDNMRMILLLQYPGVGRDMPSYLQPIAESLPLWQALALGNFVSQMMPITSTFLIRYPRLRAIGGAFYILEVLGLGVVMGLWTPQWLPLAVVFVDWDALARWYRKHRERIALSRSPRGLPPWPVVFFDWDALARWYSRESERPARPRPSSRFPPFAALYILLTLAIEFSFWRPGLDYELNLFPFSAYPMYSTMIAPPPYDDHFPYRQVGVLFQASGADLSPEEKFSAEKTLNSYYYSDFRLETRAEIQVRLLQIKRTTFKAFPNVDRINMVRAIMEVPAYPAPAVPEWPIAGLMGSVDRNGTIAIASVRPTQSNSAQRCFALEAEGIDTSPMRVSYVRDLIGPEMPLKTKATAEGFCFTPPTPLGGMTLRLRFGNDPRVFQSGNY